MVLLLATVYREPSERNCIWHPVPVIVCMPDAANLFAATSRRDLIQSHKNGCVLPSSGFLPAALLLCLTWSVAVAQVRPPNMALRQVEGNVLISPDQPKIRLRVNSAFTALPALAFPIRSDTWVERFIFVDSAQDMTIRRLVVVQFEHAQIGSAFRFVYPARPPMQWGSAVYRHGAFTADSAAEIGEHPGLEVARTEAYLTSKGYKLGNWWRVARLARAADPEGKTEIIVFYQELMAVPPSGTQPGNVDQDLPEKEARRLFENLKSAVTSD
jgi:hypothetical protein